MADPHRELPAKAAQLARLYTARFSPAEIAAKNRVWAVLCKDFFQQYVKPQDRVLDIAAGYCEFINHIRCAGKYAYDANPETARFAAGDVKVVIGDCREMSELAPQSFDLVFVSNFFEHLESRRDMDRVLQQIFRVLRAGGRLLILQPNIRCLGSRYWDFYDHVLPLTHLSLREALVLNGFEVKVLVPRFLPYTFKSRLPARDWMVRIYLKLPLLWRLAGKQMFALALRTPLDGGRS